MQQNNDSHKESVAAYHRSLSNHVSTLLRNTGSTMPPPTTTPSHSLSKVSSNTSSNAVVPPVSVPSRSCRPPSYSATSGQVHTQLSASTGSSALPGLAGNSIQSAEIAPVLTPEEDSAEKRDKEHRRAWKEVGSKMYNTDPAEFQLFLESTAGVDSGSNIVLRRSKDMAARMGLCLDTPPLSQPSSGKGRIFSSSCRGKNILSSDFHCRPPSPPIARSSSSITPIHEHGPEGQSGRPSGLSEQFEEEQHAEYEARRAMRLKKKYADLEARVNRWRDSLLPSADMTMPEIYPTPATPSIAFGMLRLSPFDMPAAQSPAAFDTGLHFRALDSLLGTFSLISSPPATSTENTKPERRLNVIREGVTTPRATLVHSPLAA